MDTRTSSILRLRTGADFRAAHIASALVSRAMNDIMTHQVCVDGWLFWVYVYADGTQKVIA
jgi:hypothetical protein